MVIQCKSPAIIPTTYELYSYIGYRNFYLAGILQSLNVFPQKLGLFLNPKLSLLEWLDFPDCPEFCVLQKPDTLAVFI